MIAAILKAAKLFKVSAPLLAAICHYESNGLQINPAPTESVGMCQVLPATAQMFGWQGKSDLLLNPTRNASYAAQWLKVCYGRFASRNARIACYNSGKARTRAGYVENVLTVLPLYCKSELFTPQLDLDDYCSTPTALRK